MIISQSQLKSFDECNERWRLGRLYTSVEDNEALKLGGEVHLAMTKEESYGSAKVRRFVKNLRRLEEAIGLKVVGREVKQTFDVMDGVQITRIIDAWGYINDDVPVIVDYKTTGNARWWGPTNDMISPLAMTWQTPVYLFPPPNPAPFDEWPKLMYYLVATEFEAAGALGVEWSFRRQVEMLAMVAELKKHHDNHGTAWAPRSFGFQCRNCEFMGACYGVPGWESNFREKKS